MTDGYSKSSAGSKIMLSILLVLVAALSAGLVALTYEVSKLEERVS